MTGRIYHNRSRFTNDPSNYPATTSMTKSGDLWALGLMSGTSLDGIDAALIRSDGRGRVEAGQRLSRPYDAAFRGRLRAVLGEALARFFIANQQADFLENFERRIVYIANIVVFQIGKEFHRYGFREQGC